MCPSPEYYFAPYEGVYSPVDSISTTYSNLPGPSEDGRATADIIAQQSQDYVDEKLAEYQATIYHLQDEQERVQKKTFVNWINSYLSKRVPPLRINDLIEDLKDGTKLLALLEVLSGERLQVERGRNLRRPHFLSNANTALQFLLSKKIKLVNINASDLVDGRPPVVLGLIWTIILYFQIEENTRALESLGHSFGGSASSLDSLGEKKPKASTERAKVGAKRALLQWVTNALPKDFNLEIKDFGPSWRDGLAFIGVIEAIRSGLINVEALKTTSNRARLETAFNVAESELGIARLLDPEDVDVDKPDERSVMTYVAQFLHKYPEPRSDALATLQSEHAGLVNWLLQRTQFLQHLRETNSLPLDYNEFLLFKEEVEEKQKIYKKLSRLVDSQSIISITSDSWSDIQRLWLLLESQLRYWQWLLDSRMPGLLGEVGDWLGRAESMINSDDIPQIMNEETASIISKKLEEHKLFFAELPNVIKKFETGVRTIDLRQVPRQQLESLEQRLGTIGQRAAQRRVRLKYLEHKCCLIAFLHLTETKLKGWTIKYGREDRVQHLLEQYRNFVSRNKIFQEFNKAFIDMQQVVDEYKKEGVVDEREAAAIDHFMRQTGERWRSVSMELRCVQSMLEEVLAYWKRWNALSEEMSVYLQKAYTMLDCPEEERMEFFQDVSVWKDKHQLLGDTVSFLVATCEEPVAAELRDIFTRLSNLWEQLFPNIKQYMRAGDILRQRKDYRTGVERLQNWLRAAEQVLSQTQLTTSDSVKAYGEVLQQLQGEVEGMEELFKEISKKFQALIPDLSREEVDKMMNTLKKEKEALVRVRAMIPMQLHLYHQLLIQQESLEAGQTELAQWLDNADRLLSSHTLSVDCTKLKEQLSKHKQYFSRTLYYRSMLESKHKVHENIVRSVDQSGGPAPQVGDSMKEITIRFNNVTSSANTWEQKLMEAIRCWERFLKSEKNVSDWLQQAATYANEKHIDSKQIVEQHKAFFQQVNDGALQELVQSGQDLISCLPLDQQMPVARSVEALQAKWKEMLSYAPLHLMKLEFRLEEAVFHAYITEMEKELSAEQGLLDRNQDIAQVTARSNQFFHDRQLVQEAEKCLQNLGNVCNKYSQRKPEDMTLKESYSRCIQQWENVQNKIGRMRSQLDKVPVQWTKYRQQFQEVVQWMDKVDQNIKNILKQVETIEEFEKERAVFQNICREVESKRETIKWLVQTLDGLTSQRNDQEAEQEQKMLEQLIARYKALIPTIEMTVTQTELYSRCYVYRKEAKEVCQLLNRVGETSEIVPHPETLGAVAQLISQQEAAVAQLDTQRPNIVSMLQRGRDLSKDPHAPAFVTEQVVSLESGWNKAYNMTLEKLNKLKSTQKVWQNYKDQKKEIVELLERAETELKQVAIKPIRAKDIASELRDKQELSKALRIATEELLKKLRDLCRTLCTMTAPERKPLLQKEVTEVEQRLEVTMETVQERVIYLEKLNAQWSRFNADLEELRDWTLDTAPNMARALQSAELGPQERLAQTQMLQTQLHERIQLLGVLEDQATKLVQEDESSPEAQQLKLEVIHLKDSLKSLQLSASHMQRAVSGSVAAFEKHHLIVGSVKPALEQLQMKINAGFPKPMTLNEAQEQLRQAKVYQLECGQFVTQLQEMVSLTDLLPPSSADETDLLQTKYKSVKNQADLQVDKLGKLIVAWQQFEAPTKALEVWLQEKEHVLQETNVDLSSPQVAKLESGLEKLRTINREISLKQAELATITTTCDVVCQGLALDGAAVLKNRVQELKAKISQLADQGRQQANVVSDVILERQEFEGKMIEFSDWMDVLNGKVATIEPVFINELDTSLQKIHNLLQDHSENQPTFNTIYDQVKQLAAQATPEEAKHLNKTYTELVAKYQDLEDNLQGKRAVLERWSELLSFHSDMSEQLNHSLYKAQELDLKPEVLAAMNQELNDIKTKIDEWIPNAENIDQASKQSAVVVKDATGKPITAVSLLDKLKKQIVKVDNQLSEKEEEIHLVKHQWDQFQNDQSDVLQDLLKTQERLQEILWSVDSCDKIQTALGGIIDLSQEHEEKILKKEELHNKGGNLMKQDEKNATSINNILTSVDSNWDKVEEMLKEEIKRFNELNSAWKSFIEAREQLYRGFQEVKQNLTPEEHHNVLDAEITRQELALFKKSLDVMKKLKTNMDSMSMKGQSLLKNSDHLTNFNKNEVRCVLDDAQNKWQTLYDEILKKIQLLEAQNILWDQIEAGKLEVLKWINDTNDGLNIVSTDPEQAQSRLNKYKDELSSNWNAKVSLQSKIGQLVKGNEDKNCDNLKSLSKLLDDEFVALKNTADGLEEMAFTFSEQEQAVRKEIKKAGDVISQIREAVVSCDDLTGDNAKILQRLNKVQGYQNDLKGFNKILEQVNSTLHDMKVNYPSFADSSLVKELSNLQKRYESVVVHSDKVEGNLFTFLRKYYDEKYTGLFRMLLSLNEKLQWCKPEPSVDQYNTSSKLSTLKDIENGLDECDTRKHELEASLALLEKVESQEKLNQLHFDKEKLDKDLEELKINCRSVGEKLQKNAALWEKYDKATETFSTWLKGLEAKVRSEGISQINLNDSNDKIKEMEEVQKELQEKEEEVKTLLEASEELMKNNPESRVGQHANQLSARYQAIVKFVANYIERLNNLEATHKQYLESVDHVKKYLKESEGKLSQIEDKLKGTPKSLTAFQKNVEAVRDFEKDRESGQLLLNRAVEIGESLFPGIVHENRESIRAELRTLRSAAEGLLDRSNIVNKKIEAILMQRSSFDDSYSQVEKWLADTRAKLGGYQLKSTQQEKKVVLHNYRALAQDVGSHRNIIKQLQDKIASLSDEESNAKLDQILTDYENLIETINGRIKVAENHVASHESFVQALEKSHDWLETLKNEAGPILCVVNLEKDGADAKLETIESLLRHKEEGDSLLDICKERLDSALEGTDTVGQAALIKEFEDQKKTWLEFLDKCHEVQAKLGNLCSKFTELEAKVEELSNWIRNEEQQVKDQSLKNTSQAKQQHLSKLKSLEEEITSRNDQFTEILERGREVDHEDDLSTKISKLLSRYQGLKSSVRESINRYEVFVREHKQFDEDYAELENWLTNMTASLKDHSEIVGDLSILQDRQKKIREISDVKNKENVNFEKLMDNGEKLYAHTSPDGRDLIRHQLKELRGKWDSFSEDIQNTIQKLDLCLLQFAEFTMSQEQLTNWLKNVEKAMQQHTELKNSLQEKRAQLQNHKIIHQEITAHQSLVEGVCDKARRLVEQTQDVSLNVYLQSIKQLFHDIVVKSQALLDNLQSNVNKDTEFTNSCKQFKEWLSADKFRLQECSDVTGEKSDFKKRLGAVANLKENLSTGEKKLADIDVLFEAMSKSTAERGVQNAEKEVEDLRAGLKHHSDEIENIEKRLQDALKDWKEFEARLDSQTKWFRGIEAVFREQKLLDTLAEKEQQLQNYKKQRELITAQEAEIDEFVDKSNTLLNSSGADRIKPLISQISNRYQLLHVLSKEVINRWQGLVEDHKNYEDKLKDTDDWLKPLEAHLAAVQSNVDLPTKQAKLQTLLAEREQAAHKLTSLTVMAEKLYPDTAAAGRENIRKMLRELRDRWDKLEEAILEQHKKQEAASLQWVSFQETLNQTLAWLSQMEAGLVQDPSSWSSTQEIRSKLLKNKTTLQEVLSHKRVIENVIEKANTLKDSPMYGQISDTLASISKRYEDLVDGYLKNITQLEDSLAAFQVFYDLYKAHQDYQKQLWDQLGGYSDFSGNKVTLEHRLSKISEIQDHLPEAESKLNILNKHVQDRTESLPTRAREAMERDLANLKFDHNKFVGRLNDIRHGLEERLRQWSDYEGSYEHLLEWLSQSETALKNFNPKSTLHEKEEQLEKYQSLILSVRQNEADFDKMSDVSSELAQTSGDSRVSVNVQQITSRFQSIHSTARDIVKKCEEGVADHKAYIDKYKQCSDWLAAANSRFEKLQSLPGTTRSELLDRSNGLKELLAEQPTAISFVNSAIELGEKLYPQTAMEGRDIVRKQLEELQNALEVLYDGVSSSERELQARLSRWSGFEEANKQLQVWLSQMEKQLPEELELTTTLDEKRALLQSYRSVLHDINSHQHDIVALRGQMEALADKSDKIEQELNNIVARHAAVQKKAADIVEKYEEIVSYHQKYSKAVMDLQEWLEATHNTVQLWGETELERVSLHTNLERLKNLQLALPEEEPRLEEIRSLAEKVIPGTVQSGQGHIRAQVDSSQQEWVSLLSTVDSTIEQLEAKLQQWSEYEQLKDHCHSWLRDTDTKLHAVDLKSTATEKRDQLENLKKLQGEIRAKELEIDSVTERAQQLCKGRTSLVSELGVKYQQISHKVKDLTGRWHQYVTTHQEFDTLAAECLHWLEEIKEKLAYCSDLSASSQKDLEKKLEIIQDLLLYKEEGFSKIQGCVELAQAVLANTAPPGHDPINETLAKLQEEWGILASKMVETKAILDDSIHRWSGFLEQIHQLNKTVEYLENSYKELYEFQTTMSEKRAQLERLKCLDEKARCEQVEVESLKAKAAEMLASGQQSHAASQAKEILDKFDHLIDNIKKLVGEREDQYRDHRLYKEAHDDLIGWLSRAREKVPSMKQRPLSDKLALEHAVAPLEALLNKQAQGELLVEHLQNTGEVLLASTSPQGQECLRNEIRALSESFCGLFKEIAAQKDQLEAMVIQWRSYKEEYERISDWLQQIDILVKAQKTALLSTVQEKEKQVKDVKEILEKLEKGQSQIDTFNQTANVLLSSHLDTYVSNQLRHLNSRYQVQINLAKDVLKKVETNFEQHSQYEKYLKDARAWIENAKEIVWASSENASLTTSKEELQSRLDKIQELLRRREEGQNLMHLTVNCGEKVLRNTKSDGRDVINNQLKELQNDWDRLVRKISTAKVHLETGLLQWADYSSSYSQLQQWITDREAKLQQVCEQKVVKARKGGAATGLSSLGIGERKATLRQTNSIVQDIVSFEPMIQSVANKAEDLLQAQPASEISTKYETLSKQAKELYAKQKETVEQHQAFIDAGNEFVQWIRVAKERLGKCSDPTGDKESLSSKSSQLMVLNAELPEGQTKLEKALGAAAQACQLADPEDKDVIEEEVALLQEELDIHVESLARTKQLLEAGIVRWTEFEDQYKDACDWLAQTEALVQGFNKLQDSLEEKKVVLEQFQIHLQTLFDWQKELDRLNMKAQVLLETCADTRVSNAVTLMTTKYNALLSMAKEMMRRLELHYQEHQQHNSLYQECQDWAERTRDKLNECTKPVTTLQDAQSKLQTVKTIRQSLETGQNKLRYALELKERVIMNTEQSGAAKIEEDTDNLKGELDRLFNDVDELRTRLSNKLTQLEELHKMLRLLGDWLDETETKSQGNEVILNDLSEKRAVLEKFKSLQKDVNSHGEMVNKIKVRIEDDPTLAIKEFENCRDRYNNLKDLIAKRISLIEGQVSEHEKYKTCYVDACDWVRKTRIEVQQCSDPHGEKDETSKKESKVSHILGTLSEGEKLVETAVKLSEGPVKNTGPEGQDTIRQELSQLKADWDGLQVMCKDTHKTLTKCLNYWKDFAETHDKMKDWLSAFEKKFEVENGKGDKRTPEDLEMVRGLLTEATNQKSVMEELNDRCEGLMEMCACVWVRDKTVQLQGVYTHLLTAIQGLVSRVEKNLSDHTDFIKARDELDTWLQRAHGTIQDCIGVGDEAQTKDRLETVKLVSQRLTEGQLLLTKVQDVFAKAVETSPADQQDFLRDEVARLRSSWEQLNIDLNSVQAQLKSIMSRWEELNEAEARFTKWIQEVEQSLKTVPDTKGELGEMKTMLERLKHQQDEIDAKSEEIADLMKDAQELAEWSNKSNVVGKVRDLKSRWEDVGKTCRQRREAVEKEIAEYCAYHQSLQETEKWLLQISFQLMAHNSLYITSREQTQEQLSQHESLLGEIQHYQTDLDELRSKGRAQIDRYIGTTPNIQPTIEKQLHNVQDSYDSLLNTAVQIKNRLLESLAKFKEYEDTLDSIMRNLEALEPAVMEEAEVPVANFKSVQSHLDIAKELNKKLQNEKTRLALAVQACEAAAACISRPSSPLEAVPPSIPDKELAVRARLEDLLDQIQTRLASLGVTLGEMEEWKRQRESLHAWISEQRAVVADWKSKPSKLRPESAKQELSAMQNLLTQIGEKRTKLLSELPAHGELLVDEPNLEEALDELEEELLQVIARKQAAQQTIDDYRSHLSDTHQWLDSLLKRMENLEKGGPVLLDSCQKLQAAEDLAKEIDSQGNPKIEEVKKLVGQVADAVSNLDCQQVDEQLKSLERRHNDIAKRIQRKSQMLEMCYKGLEGAKQEIQQVRDWIKSKMELLKSSEPIGYQSKQANEKQQALRALMKEVDGKQVLIETLEKRVTNMSTELEPNEVQQLDTQVRNLSTEHSELTTRLRGEMDKLMNAGQTREKFELELDSVQAWIKDKQQQVANIGSYLPLKAATVQQRISEYKDHSNQIKKFGDTRLSDLEKQANTLMKECTPEDKENLTTLLKAINENYDKLREECQNKLLQLEDLLSGRRQFEDDFGKCEKWLDEAQVATSSEIRSPNIVVLEEQLAKYGKLGDDAASMSAEFEKCCEQAKAIIPTLSEPDKLTLQAQLTASRDKFSRLGGLIKDRTDSLKDSIKQYKDAALRVQQSVDFMTRIQKEIKELNRPVSAKVEEVQGMVNSYEKILGELKDYKAQLGDVEAGNMGELADIVSQQNDLIRAIEDQIARLKQLLLLREQFIGLIAQITTFITKYTGIVKDIEKSGNTVPEKIKRYDDVIVKIQECEALLAAATDKGQQIAADGSAADRNSVTEQLTSLKQQLQQLRRAVERQREQHEMSLAVHGQIAQELDEVVDALHQLEGDVKSRPLLLRDLDSVDDEIQKHKALAAKVEGYLAKIRNIQETTKHEELPGALLEKLSEASSLLNTLPTELDERSKYLENNKQLRTEYQQLKDKLNRWIAEAEAMIEKGRFGVDFENVFADLEEHKAFFSSEPAMLELVSQLQHAGDKVWPSLSQEEQEELSKELQEENQLLKNTLNSAKSRKAQLEQDCEIWRQFVQASDKVKSVLSRTQFVDEPVDTLAGLHFNIQKITHALNDIQNQQHELEMLNEKAAEIQNHAEAVSKSQLQDKINQTNVEWNGLVNNLERRRETLTILAQQWEQFESLLQSLENFIYRIEERAKLVDMVVRSRSQLEDSKSNLKELSKEVSSSEPDVVEVFTLFSPVQMFLEATSPSSLTVVHNKMTLMKENFDRLKDNLKNKSITLEEETSRLDQYEREGKDLKQEIDELESAVKNLFVFGANQDLAQAEVNNLKRQVTDVVERTKNFCTGCRDGYLQRQQFIPVDTAQELTNLELSSEGLNVGMEEKCREQQRAKQIRAEYTGDVELVQNWIQKAEVAIQDRTVEPEQLKEQVQLIQSELSETSEKLDRAKKNGKVIVEQTRDDSERNLIPETLDTLDSQLNQLKAWLDETRQAVGDTLDSWRRFLQLHDTVMKWVEEKKEFLKQPLQLSCLTEARQKLHDYSNAVKSCKTMGKNLSDMSKELETIAASGSSSDLSDKLTEAEEGKTEVEGMLLERNALLSETSEEWEQCEKKMKDVRTWIDKTRCNLDSPTHKKRPLRDQLAAREKTLADIAIQKTKISVSVEKLQVHFRSGIGGDTTVVAAAEDIIQELDQLLGTVKEQAANFEACLSQIDQYQQEIQSLRQQITSAEQQLRATLSPVYLSQDRQRAQRQQEALRERVTILQSKMAARGERIKLLTSRGTPDVEPLRDS